LFSLSYKSLFSTILSICSPKIDYISAAKSFNNCSFFSNKSKQSKYASNLTGVNFLNNISWIRPVIACFVIRKVTSWNYFETFESIFKLFPWYRSINLVLGPKLMLNPLYLITLTCSSKLNLRLAQKIAWLVWSNSCGALNNTIGFSWFIIFCNLSALTLVPKTVF